MNAAEIDNPLQIEKFKIYLKISPDLDKKLKEFGNDFPLPLSENFPFSADSDIVYSLTKYFNIIKSESIEIELAVISFKLKEFFIDENINALEFEQVIEEKSKIFLAENTIIDTCKECKEYFDLLNKINHFNKWGNYFQTNMMQGIKDTNEVLGEGVCFGFAHRIISYIQNDPTMSIEKFTEAIKKITSQDRIYQATMSAHLTHFSPSIYTDIFRISKYKSEELKVVKIPQSSSVVEITKSSKLFVNNNMIPELTVAFKSLENLKKFNSSPGWLMMEVEKHIFPIRWDTKNNCYWVLDSNQGLLCFENSLTSSADAKELCIEYLSDLIKLNYSGTNEIVLSQYIKKDA